MSLIGPIQYSECVSQFLNRQFREKRVQSFAVELLEGSYWQLRTLQNYRK
jgi:hypothetical protein